MEDGKERRGGEGGGGKSGGYKEGEGGRGGRWIKRGEEKRGEE